MALRGTNNKCLLRAEEAALSGAQSCLVEAAECSGMAGVQARRTPVSAPKAPPSHEWESIVFMPQHPAGEPVAFMNGELWSSLHSIK